MSYENATAPSVAPPVESQVGTLDNLIVLDDYRSMSARSLRARDLKEERQMLAIFRKLTPESRAKVKALAEAEATNAEFLQLVLEAPLQSSAALSRIWDNPEDAVYNNL